MSDDDTYPRPVNFPHPATVCWCGHAAANHADRHRQTINRCRAQDCPCKEFRIDGDPIPAGNLSNLLVGMTIVFRSILASAIGQVIRIEHDNGNTHLTIRCQAGHHHTLDMQSITPVTFTMVWPDQWQPDDPPPTT